MNDPANLQLSAEEMRLVSDPGWILTKNSILGKAVAMLGGLSGDFREIWARAAHGIAGTGGSGISRGDLDASEVSHGEGAAAGLAGIEPRTSEELRSSLSLVRDLRVAWSPKVSRGENYRGLPWVMLDFPRVWGREDVLAIRTMFLWGQGFSVTLHLKGRFMRLYLPVIQRRRAELAAAGFFVGVHADEWRHEHTPEVFAPMDGEGAASGAAGADASGAASGASGLFREREFLKLSAAVGLDRWSEAPGRLGELFKVLADLLSGV